MWPKVLVGVAIAISSGFVMAATAKAIEVLTFQAVVTDRLNRLEEGQGRIEGKVDEINRHLRDAR